jgi:cytochrome c peroxidase
MSGSRACLLLFVLIASVSAGPELAELLTKDALPAKLDLKTVPYGLDRRPADPPHNPLTEAKAELGRALFFDPILSVDRTFSCARCHNPEHGFASQDARAIGVYGKQGTRNAPSLLNVAYHTHFFWDGRESRLERQALGPIENPVEMGASVTEVVKRLQADSGYQSKFKAAFPDGVTADNLGKALASFQRTLLLGNSRVDGFRAGKAASLTDDERHGLWLYESKARCWRCHSGHNFTDGEFHNTGVSWGKTPIDLGRFEATRRDDDRGKFKTPSLRGVARTAPYMHDGSLATLEDVVEFYNRGGNKNPQLDPQIVPLELNKDDVRSLVNFLKALSEPADKTDAAIR